MSIATFTSVILADLTICQLASLTAAGGKINLYDTSNSVALGSPVTLYPGPAQRCYSLDCHRDEVAIVSWRGIQSESIIIFYQELGCKGRSVQGLGPDGEIKLKNRLMEHTVLSYLIMESGRYPTRGFSDKCYEKAAKDGNNTLAVEEEVES